MGLIVGASDLLEGTGLVGRWDSIDWTGLMDHCIGFTGGDRISRFVGGDRISESRYRIHWKGQDWWVTVLDSLQLTGLMDSPEGTGLVRPRIGFTGG